MTNDARYCVVLLLIWLGFHVQCLYFVLVPQSLTLFDVFCMHFSVFLLCTTFFSGSLIDCLHVSPCWFCRQSLWFFYKLTFGFFTEPALHPLHYLCIWYWEIMTFWKSCIALLFHVSPLCCNVHICWLRLSLRFYLEIWVSSYDWSVQCPGPLRRRK